MKDAIQQEYGMLDLLDILDDVDRVTRFSSHFTHSGTKEVRSRKQLRPLILMNVFAEGTNIGIKRIAKANPEYEYGELHFPNLDGVLSRPIRWQLIEQQYDEMMKVTTAIRNGLASTEAILRRFNSYDRTHPTFKALCELGKAEKTIYLCEYLPSREIQAEVHGGLNVVENWNATTDFIRYAREGSFVSNSRENNEISALCSHLLQNCLIAMNTVLIERVIFKKGMMSQLQANQFDGVTPLIFSHVNPYGHFELDQSRPSILDVA